ncbi:MAG: thiosulfate sulfurtransferase GlpE [Pseudomonadales bacterium]|nr:thiosulfate sulfurtransferase GlpE [Pseudomonadales bacterium]
MSFKHLSVAQLKEMKKGEVNIIDIRDAQSFANGSIENSVLINNQIIDQYINQTDFDIPLVVCCYHGNSSQGAAQYLFDQGFKETFSLDGGYEQWVLSNQ